MRSCSRFCWLWKGLVLTLVVAPVLAGCGAEPTHKADADVTLLPDAATSTKLGQGYAADRIPQVVDHIAALGAGRGIGAIRTDYDTGSIRVAWSGEVPDDVRQYARSRPAGIEVRIVSGARYSRDELVQGRARLLRHEMAEEIGIVTASLLRDGSGLSLGVTRTQPIGAEAADRLREITGIERLDIRYGVEPSIGY